MSGDYSRDIAAVARIDSVQKMLEVICKTTGMGFSAVARVTNARWIACAVRDQIAFGLIPGGELPIETTICDAIRNTGEPVVIDHVSEDPHFCEHHVPQRYGFQSYASFPIRLPDGEFFGTLCAIDPRPARLSTPEITTMFKLFAELIGMQLHAQRQAEASHAALLDEREASQLREQFIAVLGHDLRNPLGAIMSGIEVLRTSPMEAEDLEMLDMLKRSARRMAGLIDNVLDLARGRLGGGLNLSLSMGSNLSAVLSQVVAELRAAWPDRQIESDLQITQPVACDCPRLAQMLSNLIANALAHGDPHSRVWVVAKIKAEGLELSVTNLGQTIPPAIMQQLFQPFSRGSINKNQQGLGLGLYIASEIAKAHGGTLQVESENGETRFWFFMPMVSAE